MNKVLLSVKKLKIILKKTHDVLISDASFELHSGDVMRISGLNGCGKSTLLRVLYGNTADYICEGEVIIHAYGETNTLSINDRDLMKLRKIIGYVPQKDEYEGLNRLNVLDLIKNEVKGSNMTVDYACELFNKLLANEKKFTLKSIPGKLSGGQQRMLSIFLGLLCGERKDIMIIDEPLNNLDFENAKLISNLINQIRIDNPESAILMVTHCKMITCINRERMMNNGVLENGDLVYECHHCMGEPDCDLFYK